MPAGQKRKQTDDAINSNYLFIFSLQKLTVNGTHKCRYKVLMCS